MRFFKASDGPRSAEDEAALARLTAIANRSKTCDSIDSIPAAPTESPEGPAAPETLQ